MPIDTQSKLLRVLQDQEVRPVGGKTSYKINCRVIASTNRKPEDAFKEGKLREDLYYRISAISVHLPRCATGGKTSCARQCILEAVRSASQSHHQWVCPRSGGSPDGV